MPVLYSYLRCFHATGTREILHSVTKDKRRKNNVIITSKRHRVPTGMSQNTSSARELLVLLSLLLFDGSTQYHIMTSSNGNIFPLCGEFTGLRWIPLGRDLMRERTRSRIQDGGPQKRSANTVAFLPFNADFATRNWCPLKFVFRMNTCDIKFDRICPWLLLGSVWKLTQDARTNLTWCANVQLHQNNGCANAH